MTVNQNLSFPQAIETTQSLMEKIDAGKLDEASIEQEVANLVSSKNGGRGFFVAYLTSEMSLADRPSMGVINGLKSSTAVVTELLVKNLAMSSAMIVAHSRNDDTDNIRGSQTVCRRTSNLIQQIQLNAIAQELDKLKTTVSEGKGEYEEFIKRWGYDAEQKKAIETAIASLSS